MQVPDFSVTFYSQGLFYYRTAVTVIEMTKFNNLSCVEKVTWC